jgi:hypothetical protein
MSPEHHMAARNSAHRPSGRLPSSLHAASANVHTESTSQAANDAATQTCNTYPGDGHE